MRRLLGLSEFAVLVLVALGIAALHGHLLALVGFVVYALAFVCVPRGVRA